MRLFVPIVLVIVFLMQRQAYADTFVFATSNYAPFQYIENGQTKGFKVDILREAFRRAGHEIDIKFLPWARVLKNVEMGNADFTTGQLTVKRQIYADFNAISINSSEVSFFVRHASELRGFESFEQLSDYKIIGVNKYSYGKLFDVALKMGIIKNTDMTTSIENGVAMLHHGRGDLLIGERHVIINEINNRGWMKDIRELQPSINARPTFILYSKKKNLTKLRSDIDRALQSMISDGTLKRLLAYELTPDR